MRESMELTTGASYGVPSRGRKFAQTTQRPRRGASAEEMYLKNRNIAPLKVVGMEGFFGLIIMIFIILPVLYFIPGKDGGRYENSLEAFKMMSENGRGAAGDAAEE